MKRLEDLNWKGFYAEEMADRRQEISERVMREWEVEDPEVLRVLEKGGALSFPHTYLESNLEPVMRTVRAIYRSGKGSVVALGVFHRLNGDNLETEYSLDTFRSLLDIAEETLGLPELKVDEFFLPRINISLKDPESAIRTFETEKDSILGSMGEDSVLVLTGDLTHYGYGYGTSGRPCGGVGPGIPGRIIP